MRIGNDKITDLFGEIERRFGKPLNDGKSVNVEANEGKGKGVIKGFLYYDVP